MVVVIVENVNNIRKIKFQEEDMKKLSIILLVLIFTLTALVGCGSETTTINEKETLKVGMDLKYPPFSSMDEDGNPEGLEVDTAYALGEYLGMDIEIINTDFSMLIPALETGEIDIVIGEMTIKEERKEKVDFSDPYLYGRTLALVNKDYAEKNSITDNMSVEEFFAIDGGRYVGIAGTISVSVPQKYDVEVSEATEIASALMEINNGNSDVLVGENSVIGLHYSYPDTTILYSGIKDYTEIGMAVKKGNSNLLEKVNLFIASMYETDGFYENIKSKYDSAIGEYLKDDSLGLDYLTTLPATN